MSATQSYQIIAITPTITFNGKVIESTPDEREDELNLFRDTIQSVMGTLDECLTFTTMDGDVILLPCKIVRKTIFKVVTL